MNIQHVCSAVVVFVISTLSARGLVKMDSQWLFKEAFCMNALQIHASILLPSVKFSDWWSQRTVASQFHLQLPDACYRCQCSLRSVRKMILLHCQRCGFNWSHGFLSWFCFWQKMHSLLDLKSHQHLGFLWLKRHLLSCQIVVQRCYIHPYWKSASVICVVHKQLQTSVHRAIWAVIHRKWRQKSFRKSPCGRQCWTCYYSCVVLKEGV